MSHALLPINTSINKDTKRCAIYAILLMAMAAVVFLTNLGGPTMYADEAQYALCVEHARTSGNWLTFSPYPPHPYFQKPPLYFWLTGLTYGFFGEGMVRYRFWSALFGVGSVGLTCTLGALVLSPEAGLLGGLLLLDNRYFQIDHGARTGSMDTAVTFCVMLCLVVYWRARQRRIGSGAWALIGAAAGIASLFKPAAGAPILAILAVHSLLLDDKSDRVVRAGRGILLAAGVCVAVASPYYLIVWSHAGGQIFQDMFKRAIVDTAVGGDPNTHEHMFRNVYGDPLVARRFAGQSWHALIFEIQRSSLPFALSGIGIVFAVIKSFRGKNRGAFALLALTSVLYPLIFSMSVVKRIRYVYPAFPAISIAMAAAFIACMWFLLGGERNGPVANGWRRPRLFIPFVAACLSLIFIEAVRFTHNQIDRDRCNFEAWNAYQTFRLAIRDGRMRVVFCGFPPAQFEWRGQMGLDAAECFYLEQMHEALHVDSPRDLKELLDQNKPTLLLESRFVEEEQAQSAWRLAARSDSRFNYQHRAFQLWGIDLQPLLEPRLTASSPCSAIQLLDSRGDALPSSPVGFVFTDGLIVRIAPPLRADAWLNIRLAKCNEEPHTPVRFHALLKDSILDWGIIGKLSQSPKIAVRVAHGQWSKGPTTDVVVQFLADDPARQGQTIRAAVTEAWLSVCPEPLADR